MSRPPFEENEGDKAFIKHLEALSQRNDRRALAELRRGLGHKPGTVAEAYRHIVPWLPQNCDDWKEKPYYLVATLFSMHPQSGGAGISLGEALRRVKAETKSESIEARFVALLNAHPEDVAEHLRHAISLIRSKNIPIDWGLLLRDLRHFRNESAWIQKQWAKDFWAQEDKPETVTGTSEIEGSTP